MTSEPGPSAPEHQEAAKASAGMELCRAAHERIIAAAGILKDETARRPSLLPGWSVGHVLTHVARNADGHARRLEAALRGEEVARYPGGPAERDTDIEAGATRPARQLAADVAGSASRLEDVWTRSANAGWPNRHLLAGDHWTTPESPWRRLREVEVHHVDLGIGYGPEDWSEEYVRWELPRVLASLPERIRDPHDAGRTIAWLIGRTDQPGRVRFEPWG